MGMTIHKRAALITSLIGAFLLSTAATAGTCASTIKYRNGQNLKSSSTFYYDNGNRLKSGSTLYHANGQYLKTGSSFYYANSQKFRSGSTLYHQNGQYLRTGSSWYYQNGQRLQSGSSFYHPNGQRARSGSSLYREDGSRTDFPVTLRASLGAPDNSGYVEFIVDKNSESISYHLENFIDNNLVSAKLEPVGDSFSTLISINTGYPGEFVNLVVDENGNLAACSTSGTPSGPSEFKLDGRAASIDVTVKSGYDASTVRQVLQDALDSLN